MPEPPGGKPGESPQNAFKGTAKGTLQKSEAAPSIAPAAPSRVNIAGGSPLPTSVRSHMEPRFGANFGNVQIHTGASAARRAPTSTPTHSRSESTSSSGRISSSPRARVEES